VRLDGPPLQEPWLEITPLLSSAEPRFLSLATGTQQLEVSDVPPPPLLVCAGAEGRATECVRWLGESGVVAVNLTQGVRVVGRCVKDEKPIKGAQISLVPANLTARRFFTLPLERVARRLVRSVTSDASGRFTLARVSPGDYLLEVISPGGRIQHGAVFAVPRTKAGPRDEATAPILDLGDFVLEGGAAVAVVVTDSKGAPLAGAAVGAGQGRLPDVTYFEATTDAEGRALLSGFAPLQPVTFSCHMKGYRSSQESFQALPATVVCALDALATVIGSVVRSDGEPISDATVVLRGASASVRSDGHGAFKLADIVAGTWKVVVTSPGFDAVERSVDLRAGETQDLGRIELGPGNELHGLVRDAGTKAPVPNAIVACEKPAGMGQAITGLDGAFSLMLQKQDPSVLAVSAEGYPTTRLTVPATQTASAEQLIIELSAGGRLHVSAWDDEADSPCMGCSVNVASPGVAVTGLVTDANGEAESMPLAAGPYLVNLEKLRTLGSVFQMSGGDSQRSVDVKPGAVTLVQLGSPSVTIKIRLTPPPSAEWRLLGVMASGVYVGVAGSGSVFQIRRRPGELEKLWLQTQAGSRVFVGALPPDFDGNSADFALPQTEVHGQLISKDVPVVGQVIAILRYADSSVVASTTTAASGFFACPYLPAGVYAITAGEKAIGTFALASDQRLDVGRLELPSR
jgi:hypothetical protein